MGLFSKSKKKNVALNDVTKEISADFVSNNINEKENTNENLKN